MRLATSRTSEERVLGHEVGEERRSPSVRGDKRQVIGFFRWPVRPWIVAVTAGLVFGCPRLDPFACTEDSQCDLEAGGACRDGECAYEDSDCDPSGLRWHEDVPGVGGQCVEGEVEGGSTSTGVDPTTDSSTTGSSDTGVSVCGLELPLSVDTAALSGDVLLEDYPLLVDVTSAELGGAAPDGSDVFFVDDAGTVIPHELEAIAADSIRAWVRLPAYTPGQPLALGLRFGDPSQAPTNDPTDVWNDAYVGVWHLDDPLEGPEGDLQLDSTIYGGDGVTFGTMGPDQVVDVAIGSGLSFDGDDSVEMDASFVGSLESVTISIWAQVDTDGTVDSPFFERVSGDNIYPRCRKRVDTDGAIQCQAGVNEETRLARAPDGAVPRGELRLVALTYDADAGIIAVYVDGQLEDSSEGDPGPLDPGPDVPRLGFINEFGGHIGLLDEFRVADTVLSEAWLAADAVSQSNPTAIVGVQGPATPIPCE